MCKLNCADYMLGTLAEGLGQVRATQGHLRAKVEGRASHYDWLYRRGFTDGLLLETQLSHAYHHLNYVWGCRHATLERATRCTWRDFRMWEKFPLAFSELLPDAPRCARRTSPKTKLHLDSILLGLDEAVRAGDETYLGLCAHFDAATCPQRWDPRAANVAPLTEARLKALLCQLLGALNFAWNVRRLSVERVRSLSPRAQRLRRQYPAEFSCYLTKRHYVSEGSLTRNHGGAKNV